MRYLKLLFVTVFCLASCLARAQESSPHWRDILGPFPQPDELAERYSQGEDAYNAGDYQRALDLWKPAAEFGHADSQHGMCFLYWEGKGVEKNLEKAETWCAKAQRVDEPKATFNYARIIIESYIDLTDNQTDLSGFTRGYKWLFIARQRGSKGAELFLEKLEDQPHQRSLLIAAEKQARELLPDEFTNSNE